MEPQSVPSTLTLAVTSYDLVAYIVSLIPIILISGMAGVGKYLNSPRPQSLRYLFGAFVAGGTWGITIYGISIFSWIKIEGNSSLDVVVLFGALSLSLLAVKVGNGNVIRIFYAILRKLKIDVTYDRNVEVFEQYEVYLTTEEIEEALREKVEFKKQISNLRVDDVDLTTKLLEDELNLDDTGEFHLDDFKKDDKSKP